MNPERKFFTKREVAKRLGIHPATVDRLVRDGRFPAPIKFNGGKGACRWANDVVEAWEQAKIDAAQRGSST